MIQSIAYTMILGKPLIMYGGITTLILLLTTATVGALNFRGIFIIPFKWHIRLAVTTVIFALAHAFLGLSTFYNY